MASPLNLLPRLPPRESAVQACARTLRESIVNGDLEPGARLPPERALAERFGINRLTLRSALAQLRGQGLLDVKHGSGAVVRDFAETAGPELLPALVALARTQGQRRAVLVDLLRLRRAMARAVLETLAHSVTPASVARLRAAVEAFAEVASAPDAVTVDVARADQKVIRALLKEAGPVMALCANPVFAVLDSLPELRKAMFSAPSSNVLAWRALVDALDARLPGVVEQATALLEALDDDTLKRLAAQRRPDRRRP